MAAREFRGKSHFCLQEKQIKFHLDDCPKYFSYHQDRQFPPVCPCHGWKSCTKYECVYTYMRLTEGLTDICNCRPQWQWPEFRSYNSCDIFSKERLGRSIAWVTSCPTERSWIHCRQGKVFISSATISHRFWIPPCFLFNGYRDLLLEGKAAEARWKFAFSIEVKNARNSSSTFPMLLWTAKRLLYLL
jgi:hypothetical protein